MKLGVGFHLRHHPGHRRAQQFIREGILGTITLAHAQFCFPDKRGVVDLPRRPDGRPGGSVACEVAAQYNDSGGEVILAFANNLNTFDGGTHVAGFAAALLMAGAVVLLRRRQWKKRRELSADAAMHMPK